MKFWMRQIKAAAARLRSDAVLTDGRAAVSAVGDGDRTARRYGDVGRRTVVDRHRAAREDVDAVQHGGGVGDGGAGAAAGTDTDAAAKALEGKISVRVVNVATLKPIDDAALIASAVIGLIFVAVFSFASTPSAIEAWKILIYALFWTLPVLVLSSSHK